MKPYYADEQVTLYHGDCRDVLAELPDASVDSVVTDPPYGLEFMGREWDGADGFRRSLNPADVSRDSVFGRTSRTSPEYRIASWDSFAGKREAGKRGGMGDKGILPGYGRGGTSEDRFEFRQRSSRLYQEWCQAWAAECLRVLKPGGHLLAFGGTRTFHRLTCAIEDAGFEIRDTVSWLYGSGFPKSLDVSKAIEKAAGAEREVVGVGVAGGGRQRDYLAGAYDITVPATDAASRWAGWGTALKPAWEPIVVARKPLGATVAQSVLTHGTGGLNIDECRVDANDATAGRTRHGGGSNAVYAQDRWTQANQATMGSPMPAGRWPTNVVLSHPPLLDGDGNVVGDACADRCVEGCPVAELDRQSGVTRSPVAVLKVKPGRSGGIMGKTANTKESLYGYDDAGGASRFFPVFRYEAKADSAERPRVDGVAHPTVKPLDLMRWLVRLVTPKGGVVLDPFVGSGTTAEACVVEGFHCIAVEREVEYLPLIVARLSKPLQPVLLGANPPPDTEEAGRG